ncbi:hypothetical protein B0A50_00150 [Salinomyces thailandicus]|uniref:Small ribosomal subunit protein uS7m n=1 Tax=Salinomyces thailandicus TaxID=706561 RepID=A0A4U0UF39_9PEZI|nr:hypothetical protein B0A50_00150 [Salinomyces thailandica]
MPPSINSFAGVRALALRSRPTAAFRPAAGGLSRHYADERNGGGRLPQAQEGQSGPNMHQQEHVSEEDAKMKKVMGQEGPDIEGQGTPVQDILKQDAEARKNAPEVMKASVKSSQSAQNARPAAPAGMGGRRDFSTWTRRRMPDLTPQSFDSSSAPLDPAMIPSDDQRATYTGYTAEAQPPTPADMSIQEENKGHRFPLPALPLPPNSNHKYRYDPVVQQVTNLLMQDGKKAAAQRNMNVILSTLRTAPAPTYSPQRPLLPGAPPASHLPLHPVLYLTLAIDSIAPLLRIRSQRGAAGGGVALQIPLPLGLRQRRRTAFMWILDAASKRKSRGSGNDMFATRVAEELIAVVEGRSGVWEKRSAVHRLGTTARSNLTYSTRGRR